MAILYSVVDAAHQQRLAATLSPMNKERIKKNVGHFVRLIPIAHRLDIGGNPLPQIDDEWRIEAVTDEGVCIFLPRTGHRRTLGFDHIHQYTSDLPKSARDAPDI